MKSRKDNLIRKYNIFNQCDEIPKDNTKHTENITAMSIAGLQEEQVLYKKYRALWRAVILQAFVDLKCQGSKPMDKINRVKSIMWINLNRDSFKLVCDRAELDPIYVYNCKLRIMETNPKI